MTKAQVILPPDEKGDKVRDIRPRGTTSKGYKNLKVSAASLDFLKNSRIFFVKTISEN